MQNPAGSFYTAPLNRKSRKTNCVTLAALAEQQRTFPTTDQVKISFGQLLFTSELTCIRSISR